VIEFGGVNYKTADGEIRMVMVARDVTETRRLQEERQELEQRMQQIQKLEGLGVLTGGIAHDFNNLLTPILGDASLALMELPPESPVRARLEKIKKASQRAAALTNQMLAYSGTESLQVEVLDLSRIVREMTQLVESAATRKAILEYDLADDLHAVEGDTAQLSQVLMNLITNASEALGEGTGRIAIRTGTVEADRAYLSRVFPSDDLREATYVYLEVADTGCGIDAETRQRIFDPFFSTKFTGRGLGLAAVLGIVRGHGGAIEIDSELGRGARFRALFPACERPPAPLSPKPPPAGEWRGSGTLLVADDEEDVLDFAVETLERAGLTVLRATNGSEAVETFRRHADEIGAVFLDRSMPLKSGGEAFEEIRRIRPDARIVLVSGYSEASVRERFAGRDLAGFLHKPYPPAALLRKAREALES
jgi:signal transduction histidine kinase